VSNSRCETLAQHGSRLQQRCIVLFEGFYEWKQQQQQQRQGDIGSGKIAHAIRLKSEFRAQPQRCHGTAAAAADAAAISTSTTTADDDGDDDEDAGGIGSSSDLLMIGAVPLAPAA
jgi:putative SOS response-associated peptidase YedK